MTDLGYRNIPEKTLYIDLPKSGNLRIKGILRGELTQPLAVIMHGRPGSGNDLLPYLGARYLYEHGLASLRLFMYDVEPSTRNLADCVLETHVQDFERVAQYLRDHKVPQIFAVGHSYGGLTILSSKVVLDGAVLWDASHGLAWQDTKLAREMEDVETASLVIGLNGRGYVTPKLMHEFDQSLGDNSSWSAHKGYPLKIITAPEGRLAEYGKKYFERADKPKQYVEIPEAGHSFNESDAITFKLFKETADWFKEILDDRL